MNKNRYLVLGYIVLSAILLYLSFPNILNKFGCWPLAWVALVPYFWALDEADVFDRLKISLLFSFLFFSLLVSWVMPINFLGYLGFILVLSTGPVLFSVFYFPPFENKIIQLFYIPSLWVVAEALRTLILGGFSWTLGYSQAFYTPAIQLAAITGSYGISFVLVLFNYCIFRIIKNYSDWMIYSIAAMAAIFGLFMYGQSAIVPNQKENPTSVFQIIAIQPNISPQDKWDKNLINPVIDRHILLTEESLKTQEPDMVVWPETSVPDDFIRDHDMREKISRISQEVKTHLLIGAALYENDRDYNSAVLLNGRGAVLDIYRKKHLVPFSEYLPLQDYLSFLREHFNFNIYDFYPGTSPGIFTLRKRAGENIVEQKFGVALCSEGSYPLLFRNLSNKGSGFVVLMLNDAWFKQEAALMIHAQNEIMRAVENRIPVIRVANSGWTCSIDQYGRVKSEGLKIPRLNKPGFKVFHVYPNRQWTFYNQYGDIFAFLCFLFVIIIFVTNGIIFIREKNL